MPFCFNNDCLGNKLFVYYGWNLSRQHPFDDNIIHKAGDLIGHYVTDEKGEIHLLNLYIGTYRVEETKAPKGYVRVRKDSVLIKPADIKAVYDTETSVDDPTYSNYVTMTVEYTNPRQLVDTGEDYTADDFERMSEQMSPACTM